jgi:hypothetical protein
VALGFGPISSAPISTLPESKANFGSLAVIEADDTLSATATVALTGTASLTEASDTLAATGALAIVGTEAGQEEPDTVIAAGALEISATLAITEDDDTLVSTLAYSPLNGVLNVTEDDDTLFADSTIRLPQTGAWAPEEKKSKRKSKKERERLLDQALAKAFESKRAPIIDRMPWLAEPIPEAVLLEAPEFNPTLAALQGEAQRLQDQLAQLQFNRAQEEADIELLLMAL